MQRSAIVGAVLMGFAVGCGDAATAAEAGVDVGVDAGVDAGVDVGVDAPMAEVDVAPEPVDAGRVVPACPAPVGGGDGGVSVQGNASTFGPTGGSVRGAVVTVREHPGWCAVTGADGAYRFDGVTPGETFTAEMHHAEYWPVQTGSVLVPTEGMQRLGFQAPTIGIFRVLAQYLRITADPARCQIATTVVERAWAGRYDPGGHGEPGATVTIDPPLPPEAGPVYFRYLSPSAIVPARELTETSIDGGVLFLNVPPGDYVLMAHKAGVRFTPVSIRCRAGLLVNASPPWGLQAL